MSDDLMHDLLISFGLPDPPPHDCDDCDKGSNCSAHSGRPGIPWKGDPA